MWCSMWPRTIACRVHSPSFSMTYFGPPSFVKILGLLNWAEGMGGIQPVPLFEVVGGGYVWCG